MKLPYTVSFNLTLSLWDRIKLLFGVPLAISYSLDDNFNTNITIVVKGSTANTVYDLNETAKLNGNFFPSEEI